MKQHWARHAWRVFVETPYEITISLLALVSGVTTALQPVAAPHAIGSTLPPFMLMAWAISLAVGSAAVVVGRFADSMRTESIGLAVQLGALITFMMAILSEFPLYGPAVVFASLQYIAISAGAAGRLYVVRKFIRSRRRATEWKSGPS